MEIIEKQENVLALTKHFENKNGEQEFSRNATKPKPDIDELNTGNKKLAAGEPNHPKTKVAKNIEPNVATSFKGPNQGRQGEGKINNEAQTRQTSQTTESFGPIKQKYYPQPMIATPADNVAKKHLKTTGRENAMKTVETVHNESQIDITNNRSQTDASEGRKVQEDSATNLVDEGYQNTGPPSSKETKTYAAVATGSAKRNANVSQMVNRIQTGPKIAENIKSGPSSKKSSSNQRLENNAEENDLDSAPESPARKKSLKESDEELDFKKASKITDVEENIKVPSTAETSNATSVVSEPESPPMKDQPWTRKNAGKGRTNHKFKGDKNQKGGKKGKEISSKPKARGIQWSNNSCYFDSTIFAMFYDNEYLDPWFMSLNDSKDSMDKNARSIQEKLGTIVKSLRNDAWCPSCHVQDLRNFLSQFNPRLVQIMLDVEEMLLTLCKSGLKMDPFIEYTFGSKNFYHQIFFQNDFKELRTVQELLQNSMEFQKLIFVSMPSPVFFIKMPRNNGLLEHCKFVLPDLELNIAGNLPKGNNDSQYLMDLRAVICLHDKHYTVYVRDILRKSWCYFDDLGPSIVEVNEIEHQIEGLLTSGRKHLKSIQNHHLKNLMTGAHFCIYFPKVE